MNYKEKNPGKKLKKVLYLLYFLLYSVYKPSISSKKRKPATAAGGVGVGMSLTTDPKDPRLTRYTGPEKPGPQAEVYLVLSVSERAKGFVRPFRNAYRHVGPLGPKYPLLDLTPEQQSHYDTFGYVKFEAYPESESPATGRYWTQGQLDAVGKGCQVETRMGDALSETYARNPKFYVATYCVGCSAHFPVAEFVWSKDGERVGS